MIEQESKSFKELTGMNLSSYSRLRGFGILRDTQDDTKFMNLFKYFSFSSEMKNNSDNFVTYVVKENDWFENIAYLVYESPELWWIIPMFNDIINPFEALEPGTTLKLVSPNFIYNIIKKMG